jgi:hypothetical protein
VEDGAVLRDVDVLAGEHRADALTETGLLGKLDQEAQRRVGDAVLGVVEKEPLGLHGHARAALVVGGEQLPQVHRGMRL